LSDITSGARVKDIMSYVQGGVNQMFRAQSKDLRVTKIAESVMDIKPSPDTERFLYFDPKVNLPSHNSEFQPSGFNFWPKFKQIQGVGFGDTPRKTTPFRDAIVFVVGGGSLSEHENLQQFAQVTCTFY
jgi:hypothetical protein